MKANTLGRVISGIVLTASVVVAFVQHAAISFNANKGGFVVGRRHSMAEIVSSAGMYIDDDLSSFLESAKNDFAGKTGSVASKAADMATSTATTTTSPKTIANIPIPPAPATSEPVTEVVKVAQDAVVSATKVSQDAIVSATKVSPILDEGKSRPLFSFFRASVSGQGNPTRSAASWETTKTNSVLLRDNLIKLAGKDPSDFDVPQGSLDIKKLPPFDFSHLDFKSIQQYFESLPSEQKGFVALAATGAFLIILGTSNKNNGKKEEAADIEATSEAIGGLTEELTTLQDRMKALEATGMNLDSQLMDAKTKLTQKELDISKAKLKAADDSLSLNREINMLKRKLSENDGMVKTLDVELSKAREECMDLLKELDKAREEQEKAKKAAVAKKQEAEAAKTKAAPKKKDAPKPKATPTKKAAPKKAAEKPKMVEKLPEAAAAPKKAAPKKAAPKGKTAPKKIESEKKPDRLPEASAAAPKEVAPKKASVKNAASKKKAAPKKVSSPKASEEKTAAPKKAAAPAKKAATAPMKAAAPAKKAATAPKKTAPKKKDTSDLTTLTKSALSRTTVKVFNEFLASKGIPTVDKNGKQLKKADLIKAVNAIPK
mmetsp:Transcript_9343/g.27874  ORF Transcript_9343/g.27874 Transcript_9343/m.27874 type:complete len:603 (-) Transcript_9343:3130-4938(-)